jgi:hypothetical protein
MKHPKLLFGFITALGIFLMGFCFLMPNWTLADYYPMLAYFHSQSDLNAISTQILVVSFVSGIFFLSVGTYGIGNQYLHFEKIARKDLQLLAVAIILAVVVFGLFWYFWMGALTVGF